MVTISIDDMQRDLVGYLHRVKAGETLLVLEASLPLAEIKPVREFGEHFAVGVGEPRPFGLCAGEFVVPDDFDAPLPEDILRDFEGAGRKRGNEFLPLNSILRMSKELPSAGLSSVSICRPKDVI